MIEKWLLWWITIGDDDVLRDGDDDVRDDGHNIGDDDDDDDDVRDDANNDDAWYRSCWQNLLPRGNSPAEKAKLSQNSSMFSKSPILSN